jgi:hypothetical protein
MKKLLTYNLPNVRFGSDFSEGKTSTQPYDGLESLILWTEKETGIIERTFDPADMTEQPRPLHLDENVLEADTMENTIKIALLFGGIEPTKFYEVSVGPADQPNALIPDPTDIRDVFSENDILADYTADLVFKGEEDRIATGARSWDFIRDLRNTRLEESDSKVVSDMPADLKALWVTYREQLRNMPVDWANVPVEFIKFPVSPANDDVDNTFEVLEEIDMIMIPDRSTQDVTDLGQLGL